MKQHWKLTLSYDGSDFHGWQVQPGLPTIQGTLAAAIRQVVGEEAMPQGSGRTDAGVHALAQVASFALDSPIPPPNFARALNSALPPSVRVTSAENVGPNFHARYSAHAKTYEYRIFLRRHVSEDGVTAKERVCSPFLAPFVWDCRWKLCLDRMQKAASLICGEHDFTSFAASDPELHAREADDEEAISPSAVRTIRGSSWVQDGEILVYQVCGNGFLHHMVRNLVGTFVDVGRGTLKPEDITGILVARERSAAGPTAPAQGLFLRSVEYDATATRGMETT